MARIFVSYRREDTAGHAGRLTDYLSRHFGEGEVFRDIEHISPGLDFVQSIEQAVGSCDILLALIGRQWLTISDAHGQRRLDNPDDFVLLELTTALERNIRVIPVLVQGAKMPSPNDLPERLMSLARRNAVELRDTSWSSDVDRLIEVLEQVLYAQGSLVTRPLNAAEVTASPPTLPAAAPEPPPATPAPRTPVWRTCSLIMVPAIILLCLAGVLLASNVRDWLARRTAQATMSVTAEADPVPSPTSGDQASADSDQPTPAAGTGQSLIMLPAGTEVTVGEATYTILSAQVDRAGTGELALQLEIRLTTKSLSSRNLWSDSTRLLIDGVPRAPTEAPSITVAGFSAEEGTFVFTVPDTVQNVDLQLGQVGEETTIVPIDLTARAAAATPTPEVFTASTGDYPRTLPAGTEVTVGEATYTILSAQVDRAGTGELALQLEIRLTTKSLSSRNLWSDSTRLLIDGVPRAPTEAPSITVAGFSAEEGTFVFTVPDTVQNVDLQLGQVGEETTIVPIDLEAPGP